MKILWLCNIRLPHISEYLNSTVEALGGWLTGMSSGLIADKFCELVVLYPNVEKISGDTGKMKFYGFTADDIQNQFAAILKQELPDIVHIFGTEFSHTLDMVNACESLNLLDKTVINIQGLVSIIANHYYANLPINAVNAYTFRDFIKQDNIKLQAKKFGDRGKSEIEALKKARHVIGRTDWDKACTTQINSNVKYHFCNETLRDAFYENSWDINKCQRHSIFLSQAQYPIKGFHNMLEAMPHILARFKDAHIYVTGKSPLDASGIAKLKQTYYNKYLGELIKKYSLQDKITFLGSLSEKEICDRFLKSHVFVSASSIENSPNSVGEAMILGVPTVSSHVGGVANMLAHDTDGFLYQHDAPYMLAHYVCEIFAKDDLAQAFSKKAHAHAKFTHDKKKNLTDIKSIYQEILA